MDIDEVLKLTNDLVFAHTGIHLDYLQEAILKGTLQSKTYSDIAEEMHLSQSHVRNTGSELWKTLSECLNKDITKTSFKSILENANLDNISSSAIATIGNVAINNFNICPTSARSSPSPPDSSTQHPSPIIDLSDAPELTDFYNRTAELSTLKQWILEDRTRLITIYGVSEMGKSTLTLKLIEDIQTEFDAIIWRSLSHTPTLSTLQTELNEFLAPSPANPSATLIDIFRHTRCLVILDDVQNIFASGQLAGEYLTDYKDYGKFFKQIARTQHYSCVILLSWEKSREIATLEGTHKPTRSLHLKGLDSEAESIFREQELKDEEHWLELINLYQGHPVWLTIIAATIWELFEGQVAQFLENEEELYLGDLEPILEAQLERLSEVEQRVMAWLGSQEKGVDLSVKLTHSQFSRSELWEAMQSLGRRGLVEKRLVEERSHFVLHPLWQQYCLEIQ